MNSLISNLKKTDHFQIFSIIQITYINKLYLENLSPSEIESCPLISYN